MNEAVERFAVYDRPQLQKTFVRDESDERKSVSLSIEGIHCGGCVHRCEKGVLPLRGVKEFQINLSTRRAQLVWDESEIRLSAILSRLAEIGFPAYPYEDGQKQNKQRRLYRQALTRLAVAGIGMMQVMMFSVALYAGDYQDIDQASREFLRWVSLLVALVVVFYSARPFFSNALQGLRYRQLGMDLPVSIAIGGAFSASCWATLSGRGDVYFDSVTMFTFFLLLGRFLELNARLKAGRATQDLVHLLPATATRIRNNRHEMIAVAELQPGDQVLIKPGESIPADSKILAGISSVDESLLTGESMPLAKRLGDRLIGGSINIESPLTAEIEKVGNDTVLASMVRLLNRAQLEKPKLARLADQIAGWFVAVLLIVAASVYLFWLRYDPENAFWVMLSVLVVTCPCALSLATPAALTAATEKLSRLGLLPTRGHALETLANVNHMIFDKTGTLTQGRLRLQKTTTLGELSATQCLAITAALEQYSEHPAAKALVAANAEACVPAADQVKATPGQGIEGLAQGRRYRVGSPGFVRALSQSKADITDESVIATRVALGDEQGLLALFYLTDVLRPQAHATIKALKAKGIEVELLSGDDRSAVAGVAERLDIGRFAGALAPEEKQTRLRELQKTGAVVAMIGDGVNDSPVLAQAQVSVAIGSGSEIARSNADMVLVSENLDVLLQGVSLARRTYKIIRQNLGWALAYNAIALPLAAAGMVPPWLAAVGMSTSSLIVVLNALRLSR